MSHPPEQQDFLVEPLLSEPAQAGLHDEHTVPWSGPGIVGQGDPGDQHVHEDGTGFEPVVGTAEHADTDTQEDPAIQEGEPVFLHEDELYTPKELIRENPKDVIQIIEEEGVAKLGQFDVQDHLVLKALGREGLVTCGTQHLDVNWQAMWMDLLSNQSHAPRSGWSKPCTVEAHVVTIRDAAAQGNRGLLQPLIKRFQARASSAPVTVFGLPAVHAVIHYKWHTWARRFLMYELLVYMIWLLAFTAFTLLFEYESEGDDLNQVLSSPRGIATVACNILALVAMTPFTYMELCTISAYKEGWLNLWNVLDVARYGLQLLISVIHLQRSLLSPDTFPVMLSIQHILLWTKLHDWARVFSQKNLVVDTMRIVLSDMQWFLTFMALTMLGFAFAFYSLFRHDREASGDFTNFWHACASQVSYLLAMFDFNIFYNLGDSIVVVAVFILFILFEFIMYITLLNIMIAIMTSSFNKQSKDEGPRFLFNRAVIIDELESTLPGWLKRPHWFPPFVHVLKLHPASTFDDINLNSVLSGIGSLESNLLTAQQDLRARLEAVEIKVGAAHDKLAAAAALAQRLMRARQQLEHASSVAEGASPTQATLQPGQ